MVHALLATGAVHHHLSRVGLRCDVNLIIETGTARDPHHIACLLGFGATAVYPYLAYQTLFDLGRRGILQLKKGGEQAQIGRSYRKGIYKGLSKIISKMGICHHRQLSRRAAVRDRRPGAGRGRTVLPGYAVAHRRRRLRAARHRSARS